MLVSGGCGRRLGDVGLLCSILSPATRRAGMQAVCAGFNVSMTFEDNVSKIGKLSLRHDLWSQSQVACIFPTG